LMYIPFIPRFLKAFCHEVVFNCIKCFFCIYWDDQVFFVFASINVLYYIYSFAYVEPPLHYWDKADLVMVNYLSDMMLDLVCHCFNEDFFVSVFIKEIGL
jgi:hypothetical protein